MALPLYLLFSNAISVIESTPTINAGNDILSAVITVIKNLILKGDEEMFKMNKLFKKINYEKKHQINKNLNRKKTIPWSIYLFKN